MIYGRLGRPVTIVRRATLADVQELEGREPDARDRSALSLSSYLLVLENGKEVLYHQCFLHADGGAREIAETIGGSSVSKIRVQEAIETRRRA
jgi:hypothetical protein